MGAHYLGGRRPRVRARIADARRSCGNAVGCCGWRDSDEDRPVVMRAAPDAGLRSGDARDPTQLRVLRPRPCGGCRGLHLHVRVHLVPRVRRALPQTGVPELRWKSRAPPGASSGGTRAHSCRHEAGVLARLREQVRAGVNGATPPAAPAERAGVSEHRLLTRGPRVDAAGFGRVEGRRAAPVRRRRSRRWSRRAAPAPRSGGSRATSRRRRAAHTEPRRSW